MMAPRIEIYDTTLRDGTQGEGVSVSCDDKLRVAKRLADFGVDWIEAGWPGSNPKDAEFFRRAQTELDECARAKLAAFGSTRRKGLRNPGDDPQLRALVESGCGLACIVCKSSAWQTEAILGASLEENVAMIESSVRWLTEEGGLRVYVDMEHFFDGFLNDDNKSDYGWRCVEAAQRGGAEGVVLCDTNGGATPWDVEKYTRMAVERYSSLKIGIHAHNDGGLAVANSLAALRAGASVAQGTVNGVGERCGNADLCAIIPALKLKDVCASSLAPASIDLARLTEVSRFVDETLNRNHDPSRPYVGASAFAHKGGLHVSAIAKDRRAYEHVDPAAVGNSQRVLVSELSGRANIWSAIERSGLTGNGEDSSTALQEWKERAQAILARVKTLESLGYSFEGADASVHLMLLHASPGYCLPFRVHDYSVSIADADLASTPTRAFTDDVFSDAVDVSSSQETANSRATVKVAFPGQTPTLQVAEGNGPVDALAGALQRALRTTYPTVGRIAIADYKVRILDPVSASRAATRVVIDFKDTTTGHTWTAVGVDRNVISASANALVDGFEFAVIEHADFCVLCDDDLAACQVEQDSSRQDDSARRHVVKQRTLFNGASVPVARNNNYQPVPTAR